MNRNLWDNLDTVINEFPDASSLGAQGLGGIAAWRIRQRGEVVPEALARYERGAAFAAVTAAPLLTQIIQTLGEEVLVLKGPENAALYPARTLRTYGDLDLLVPDLLTAETMLTANGFHLSANPAHIEIYGRHHDSALVHPQLSLAIEFHRHPGWLAWSTPPSNRELFRSSVPSVTGVPGARALPPTWHILHLLSHAWRHNPYSSLIHLVDIEILRQHVDPDELQATATYWGLENVLSRTFAAIDRLIYREPIPESPLDRIWARHLREHRSQTLAEHFTGAWLKYIAAPTYVEQIEHTTADFRWSLSARPWQSKRMKAKRIAQGLISLNTPVKQYLSMGGSPASDRKPTVYCRSPNSPHPASP